MNIIEKLHPIIMKNYRVLQWGLLICISFVSILLEWTFYPSKGLSAFAYGYIPILTAGFLFGKKISLFVATLIILGINIPLEILADPSRPLNLEPHIVPYVTGIAVALAMGHMHDQRVRLRELLKEKELAEEEIRQLALHDSLTGLPNRRLLTDRLTMATAQVKREQSGLAVLLLDLDGFKSINDRMGHHEGDRVLKQVAGILRSSIRDSDTVARIGGDEFTILLLKVGGPEDVMRVTRRIHDRLGSHSDKVGASIGASFYPKDSSDAERLMVLADSAMYEAKRKGKNRLHFYNVNFNNLPP